MNLTFRVEDGVLWACDDEGQSRRVCDSKVDALYEWWAHAPSQEPFDGRTAAVLADLGQARSVRPVSNSRAVSAFPALKGEKIALGPLALPESQRFSDVLRSRHSARIFGSVSLSAIATLLVRCARLQDAKTVNDGYDASHRPVPSAGGRHPFEVLLLSDARVECLEAGVYALNPVDCTLTAHPQDEFSAELILGRIGERLGSPSPPPAAICLVAHLDRTLSRYPSGMSLIWRDAGALLQTLHLCAVDLSLRSCVVGTCGLLRDDQKGPIIDMGLLAFGGQPGGCI